MKSLFPYVRINLFSYVRMSLKTELVAIHGVQLVQSHRMLHLGLMLCLHIWQFLLILSLNLCFVSEIWWDTRACTDGWKPQFTGSLASHCFPGGFSAWVSQPGLQPSGSWPLAQFAPHIFPMSYPCHHQGSGDRECWHAYPMKLN